LFIYGVREYDSGVYIHIQYISEDDVQDFIDCYIQVFKTLCGILPEGYLTNQITKASHVEYHQKVQRQLENNQNILLVSKQNGEVTGIAWGNVKENSAWLGFIGVKKPFRRQGIGRALLHRFIGESFSRGALKISLDTDPSLVPAIRLYESEGFKREGTLVNPYGLEFILFNKNLTN
jgi:GNAT superfamily N-acetyltransferase